MPGTPPTVPPVAGFRIASRPFRLTQEPLAPEEDCRDQHPAKLGRLGLVFLRHSSTIPRHLLVGGLVRVPSAHDREFERFTVGVWQHQQVFLVTLFSLTIKLAL